MDGGESIEQQKNLSQPAESERKWEVSNTATAKRLLESSAGKVGGLNEIINEESQVVFFGEEHTNYAIPLFMLEEGRIEELKRAGITSVGFEIEADEENIELFEKINAGNIEAIDKIDWSLGFGNPIGRQLKAKFVKRLIEAGIKVYPFSHWSEKGTSYNEQTEMEAAQEIIQHLSEGGKTLVFIGSGHVARQDNERKFPPSTADCVENLGYKAQKLMFIGGATLPFLYNRSTEYYLLNAYSELGYEDPRYIKRGSFSASDFPLVDGIIMLPRQPFLSAQQPAPENLLK